ncbi:MAG: 50S ribosomal protein L24 [Mycoplasmataceae bacterium]|jgi:large subunit ribosomal protein L24|nr:50S ribosomal protein L24 [Mycoplasmataceae bacterium]
MQRIKKGDKVRVISGKFSTKEGIVTAVNVKQQTALVEGINIIKIHKKANKDNQKGGITEKEAPLHLSKLALVVDKADRGISKISYVVNKENKKVRIAKKTKTEVTSK